MHTITNNNIIYYNITTSLDIEYDSNKFIQTKTGFHVVENTAILLIFTKINIKKLLKINIVITRSNNYIAFNELNCYISLNENDIVNFYVSENDIDSRIYETSFRIHSISKQIYR